MFIIRELFHSLGNIHNLLTIVSGATKELVKECLTEEDCSPELKDKLSNISKNLDGIISNTQTADKKLREIYDWVHKVIDPDTGKVK